jgi:DNA repair exonuclease SbcCD ATPase subunit
MLNKLAAATSGFLSAPPPSTNSRAPSSTQRVQNSSHASGGRPVITSPPQKARVPDLTSILFRNQQRSNSEVLQLHLSTPGINESLLQSLISTGAIKVSWSRIRPGGSDIVPVSHVTGPSYLVTIDDVGCRIMCRVRDTSNSQNAGFAESETVTLDPILQQKAKRFLDSKSCYFIVDLAPQPSGDRNVAELSFQSEIGLRLVSTSEIVNENQATPRKTIESRGMESPDEVIITINDDGEISEVPEVQNVDNNQATSSTIVLASIEVSRLHLARLLPDSVNTCRFFLTFPDNADQDVSKLSEESASDSSEHNTRHTVPLTVGSSATRDLVLYTVRSLLGLDPFGLSHPLDKNLSMYSVQEKPRLSSSTPLPLTVKVPAVIESNQAVAADVSTEISSPIVVSVPITSFLDESKEATELEASKDESFLKNDDELMPSSSLESAHPTSFPVESNEASETLSSQNNDDNNIAESHVSSVSIPIETVSETVSEVEVAEQTVSVKPMDEMKDTVAEMKQMIESLEASKITLETTMSSLREENRQKALAIKEKEYKISQLTKSISESTNKISTLVLTLQERDKSINQLSSELASLHEKNDVHSVIVQAKTREIDRLSSSLNSSSSELNTARAQLSKCQEEIDQLKLSLQTTKTEAAASSKSLSSLQSELQSLTTTLRVTKDEKDSLSKKLSEIQISTTSVSDEIAALKHTIAKLTADHSAAVSRADSLTNEISSARDEILSLTAQRNDAKLALISAQTAAAQAHSSGESSAAELSALTTERDDLRTALEGNSHRLAVAEAEVRSLTLKLHSSQAEIDALKEKLTENAKGTESIIREKTELQSKLASAEAAFEDANGRANAAEAKVKKFSSSVDKEKALQVMVEKLQEAMDSLTSERNAAVKKAEALRKDLSRMVGASPELKTPGMDLESLVRSKKALEEKVVKLSEENAKLREENQAPVSKSSLSSMFSSNQAPSSSSTVSIASHATPIPSNISIPSSETAASTPAKVVPKSTPVASPIGTSSFSSSVAVAQAARQRMNEAAPPTMEESLRIKELQRLANGLYEQLAEKDDVLSQQKAQKEMLAARIRELETQVSMLK